MKKDKRMQNKNSNNVTNKNNNNVTSKNNNNVTNCKATNKASNSNNIGFDDEDQSFELDPDSSHSFELR